MEGSSVFIAIVWEAGVEVDCEEEAQAVNKQQAARGTRMCLKSMMNNPLISRVWENDDSSAS